MSVFRSEIQVPINKGNIEARHNIDLNNSNFQSSSFSSPSLDQWRNKFKNQITLDDSTFSNNSSPKLFSNNDMLYGNDCGFSFNSENFFRQLQTQIAKGNDENMHFKAKFDIKDIVDPDKIKVFVKEMSLIMSIEYKEIVDSKCSITKEYTKRFNLPPNIISDSITCTISIDNILILDGILDTTIDQRKYSSSVMPNSIPFRSQSMVSSSSSGSLLHSPTANDKYSICVHIGCHYNPQDISIKTKDDKIFIKARHEEKSDSRTNYREFSKEILLPERVDPLSLSAIFNNGYLSIEAPFIN
uniref:HSP34 n=1 Tax=Dugesia japonica TaxID=6161 RepID=A0A2U8U4D2_DUGJA|nr:HSP34 [Dugesia japonica]